MRNRAVEHNVAAFSELSFDVRWQESYAEASTTSNSANLMSSCYVPTAAMVDICAEKVDECPLNRGCKVLFAYNWDRKSCPLYGVVGCPLFRGCLSNEVNGKTVGTFRVVCYIVGVCC